MVQNPAVASTTAEQIRLYVLLDEHGRRRYVGVSANPERRARMHFYRRHIPEVRGKNPELCAWLDTLDGPPTVRDLGPVPYEARHLVEGACINAHRQAGIRLFNRRVGMRWLPEDRARISAGMRRYRAEQRAAALAA